MHLLLQSQPLEPESLLISSIDDELCNELSHAFSKDLKAGDWNCYMLHFILLSSARSIGILIGGIHVNSGIADPRLVIIFVLVGIDLAYGYLSTRLTSLFDKVVDNTADRFQSRFAEKGLRVSIVYYYTIHMVNMCQEQSSRYVVFTALPHPRTVKLVYKNIFDS